MKKIPIVLIGLLCLVARITQAESFESQVLQISQTAAAAASQMQENAAAHSNPLISLWKKLLHKGTCSAANGYPVDPATNKAVCPPYKSPLVIFSPHPDDETLGLGGLVRAAVLAKRTVVVELMTRGTASGARYSVCPNGKCMSPKEFGAARVREFTDSVRRLGVTAVKINDYPDSKLRDEEVAARVRFWTHRADKGLSLAGVTDGRDYNDHPDHAAVFRALVSAHFPRTQIQSVYYFRASDGEAESRGFERVLLKPAVCAAKRHALEAYRFVDEAHGRYGIGWLHSTGDLFDGANDRCYEYNFPKALW